MKPFKAEIIFEHKTYNGSILLEEYRDKKPALRYRGSTEDITVLTVWVEGLKGEEVAIKNYGGHPSDLAEQLYKLNIITKSHRSIASGFVKVPICYLTDEFKKAVS